MHRPLTTTVLALALGAWSSGCSADDEARVVATGEVVTASYTAPSRGEPVHVMLPSGRANLTLGEPADEVPAALTADGAPVVPADGDVLVPVSWSLDRGAYGQDINLDVAPAGTVLGDPAEVGLHLVGGGESIAVPGTGTLAPPEDGRTVGRVWVAVPDDVAEWSFEVDYEGLVQTVDARTGDVDAGAAAPLYDALPRSSDGTCEVETSAYAPCLLDQAVGYPYVAGPGWAPPGRTYAVLALSIDTRGPLQLTLGGRRPDAVLREAGSTAYAFLVRPGPDLALEGTTTLAGAGPVRFSGTVDGSSS